MLRLEPSMVLVGDTIDRMGQLPERCVQCCVTSPPYWGLRDYGVDGQIGLEATPDEFVARMVEVFRAVRRVLRDDGTLWLNLGDSYAGSWGAQSRGDTDDTGQLEGSNPLAARQIAAARREQAGTGSLKRTPGLKPKDLCGMPWRVVLALQADGWYWRSTICWAKKSPMPESCTDRPTSAWEPIFLLTKNERYFYDAEAVKEESINPTDVRGAREKNYAEHNAMGVNAINPATATAYPTRNMRNVWHLAHEPYSEAHFAVFPTEVPRRAIKAGTSEKGCCPVGGCRAPWRRVITRTKVTRERPNDYTKRGPDGADEGTGNSCANSVAGVSVRTLGWLPTCRCGGQLVTTFDDLGPEPKGQTAEAAAARRKWYSNAVSAIDAAQVWCKTPVPCLVLDPFLGSGTTVAVARELGRWGVGCELNPQYAELARVRIGKAERPGTFRDMREGAASAAPLFLRGEA